MFIKQYWYILNAAKLYFTSYKCFLNNIASKRIEGSLDV